MSTYTPIRGLDPQRELSGEALTRDTRPILNKAIDALRSPQTMSLTLMGHGAAVLMFPAAGIFILLSAILLTTWGMTRREAAPLKMPIQSGLIDPNEINPSTKRPIHAQGIFHLGNVLSMGSKSRDTGKGIWLTNDDCRQHFLVLGTTGSGKTEALLGFCANALSWGSGFLYCDGKGDVSLFGKVYALARRFGREDDVLVINLMTSNTDVGAGGGKILSNTLNPFTSGSSDSLTQMVVSLMDEVGGDGAMWKGRAVALFTGVMRGLVWKREQGLIDLNIGLIRDHLNLAKIIDLANPEKEADMPVNIRTSIDAYLSSLPGYTKEKGHKQGQTTLDQHGFLQMQFTKILGNLADVYGHIFLTPHGDVDMNDVVLNRRILVIMLPALEKSPDEVSNLGKIIVATLKGMMGSTLGSMIEGDHETVIKARPYSSPSPFTVVLDEVGYYCVSGMAVMAAQARSLGFSLVFASQDIPAMMRENDKEAKSIIANTTTKIFMRVEETEMTAKLAIESAGKGYKTQVGAFQGRSGETQIHYNDDMQAKVEMIDRISGIDLRALAPGQCYITWRDLYFKVQTFHANPEGEYKNINRLELRANHFIPVSRPNPADVSAQETLPLIAMALADPAHAKSISDEAKAARAKIEATAAKKADPSTIRQEIPSVAVAMVRAIAGSAKGRQPSGNDYMQAACASIAGVLLGAKRAGETFAADVKSSQGLGVPARGAPPPRTAASAPGRAASEIPTQVPAAAAADRGIRRPQAEDEYAEDPEFAEEAFRNGREREMADALGHGGPAAAARALADLDSPSVMRTVEHGVTVGNDVFRTSEDIHKNDQTVRMLASLDFDGEPGVENVDAGIEEAVAIGEEPPPPSEPPAAAEIERADRTSAAATQWPDRAAKRPEPAMAGAPESEIGLDEAVKTSDLNKMTDAFLADLFVEEN